MSRIAAYLIAGLCACAIMSASQHALAQSGPSQAKSRTLHFTNGLMFEVPPGWRFSELSSGSVTLHYGDDDKAFAKENRNRFTLGLRLGGDADTGKNYGHYDRQGRQTFPGGTEIEWYAGPRFQGLHYAFSAQIRNDYRYLTMVILDRSKPEFSVSLVEKAMLDIARSARRTESHRTFFHPAGMQAALSNELWFNKSAEGAIRFGCFQVYCGKDSNTWLYAYRSAVAFKTDAEALKDLTGYWEKQEKLKIGPTRRIDLEDGTLLWTEQPGTARPILGVVRRRGGYFFVSAYDLAGTRYGVDRLRPHFLLLGTSLRPWDGR